MVVPNRGFPLNNELTDFDSTAADLEGNPNANAPQVGLLTPASHTHTTTTTTT